MKIIFLDIDGVLNHSTGPVDDKNYLIIDPEHVEFLNKILTETGAELVISSTWREKHDAVELKRLLQVAGVSKDFIGVTPSLWMGSGWSTAKDLGREAEIRQWLESNQHLDIEAFAIIEDQEDMGEWEATAVVRTNFNDGLGPPHVDRAVRILNQGQVVGTVDTADSKSAAR